MILSVQKYHAACAAQVFNYVIARHEDRWGLERVACGGCNYLQRNLAVLGGRSLVTGGSANLSQSPAPGSEPLPGITICGVPDIDSPVRHKTYQRAEIPPLSGREGSKVPLGV
jgi:ribosomal protein S27AE